MIIIFAKPFTISNKFLIDDDILNSTPRLLEIGNFFFPCKAHELSLCFSSTIIFKALCVDLCWWHTFYYWRLSKSCLIRQRSTCWYLYQTVGYTKIFFCAPNTVYFISTKLETWEGMITSYLIYTTRFMSWNHIQSSTFVDQASNSISVQNS